MHDLGSAVWSLYGIISSDAAIAGVSACSQGNMDKATRDTDASLGKSEVDVPQLG
jgi:hypothetical protein